MAEMIIRPTMKFIYLGYLLVVLIVVASVVALMRIQMPPDVPPPWQTWIPWLPVPPLARVIVGTAGFTAIYLFLARWLGVIRPEHTHYFRGILGTALRIASMAAGPAAAKAPGSAEEMETEQDNKPA